MNIQHLKNILTDMCHLNFLCVIIIKLSSLLPFHCCYLDNNHVNKKRGRANFIYLVIMSEYYLGKDVMQLMFR